MGRDQQDLPAALGEVLQPRVGEGKLFTDHGQQGIDHRVAGDNDGLGRDPLGQQVVSADPGGGKVEARDLARDLAVGFFRERRKEVPTAKSRFGVHNGDSLVKGRDGSGSRRGCIALDYDCIGLVLGEQLVQSVDSPCHDGGERLALLQDIEVVIRRDAE